MDSAHAFISDLTEKISMPEIYQKIRQLLESPNATLEDYETIIETDSILTIRMIRIANSEFFGYHRKVDTLYDAIALIGTIQLHDLLLSSLCIRTFYTIPEPLLNVNAFWLHAIKCGIAARTIARICRLPASNRFFTLGLLLDIGHAAMFVKQPDLMLVSLHESQQKNRPIDAVEREYFGFDYCQLGAALLQQWHLPDVYPQTIQHHLTPEFANPTFQTETTILNVAYYFCENADFLKQRAAKIRTLAQRFPDIPLNVDEQIAFEIDKHSDQIYAMLSPPNACALSSTHGVEV